MSNNYLNTAQVSKLKTEEKKHRHENNSRKQKSPLHYYVVYPFKAYRHILLIKDWRRLRQKFRRLAGPSAKTAATSIRIKDPNIQH